MTYIVSIVLLLVGLTILIIGADALVRGSAQLAKHLGLSPFAIGVTVVAFGTSAPELFASIGAALQGQSELAIGNVVGSNIANIALILGIAGLIMPIAVDKRVRVFEVPLMVMLTIVTMVLLIDHQITRIEGCVLFAGLIGYVFNIVRTHKEDIEHGLEEVAGNIRPVWIDLLYIVAGIIGLGLGARVLVLSATDLALSLGISSGIIGTTIVAFGTSVPELAATVRAAINKQAGLAVGNIVGSNVFNLLSVLGVTAIIQPLSMDVSMDWHVYFMLGIAVVFMIWILLRPVIAKLMGVVLLACYLGYVVLAYAGNTVVS